VQKYDYIIIGSGFGGSVSALRLVEKGYSVCVIEKGKHFKADDFPKSNMQVHKWLWVPFLKFHGIMKISFFRHISIISGVGVGGGSLTYANTLPVPKSHFFNSGSWSELNNWEETLKPFYQTAKQMLGATKNPTLHEGDLALQNIALQQNRASYFEAPDVAVFFGEPKEVADPYFNGKGPARSGCTFCGACMTGCKDNAKNTLDKNYLYLAQKKGLKIIAEHEVYDVSPSKDGYEVKARSSTKYFKKHLHLETKNVIFSGGVLGTIKLLLKLKKSSLPKLSDRLGEDIRSNNESLISVYSHDKNRDFSKGIAIGSFLHVDEHSHLEIVRYAKGSNFWRFSHVPMVQGKTFIRRFYNIIKRYLHHPIKLSSVFFSSKWAEKSSVLLFMQSLDSTLKFEKGIFGLKSKLSKGEAPTPFLKEAQKQAELFAKEVNGTPYSLALEPLFGIASTAHILGGAVMGKDESEGVINERNEVFNYKGLYVCDGSMISSNIGVNPSLSITAISEYAMSHIPKKLS
jgi:cholesterol oxidase